MKGHVVFGIFLVVIGLLSLLNNLGVIVIPSLWRLLWPSLIIWIGLSMVMRQSRRRIRFTVDSDSSPNSNDLLNFTAVLGGAEHKSNTKDFRGANLTAFMGGVQLDLRDAKMEKEEAVIDVFAAMGGVEIRVPSDWIVVNECTPVLGGYEDKTTVSGDSNRRVVIRGNVFLGGVEVKN